MGYVLWRLVIIPILFDCGCGIIKLMGNGGVKGWYSEECGLVNGGGEVFIVEGFGWWGLVMMLVVVDNEEVSLPSNS